MTRIYSNQFICFFCWIFVLPLFKYLVFMKLSREEMCGIPLGDWLRGNFLREFYFAVRHRCGP